MGVLNSFKMEPITRDSMTLTVTTSQESSQKSPNPLTELSLCRAPQEALKTQQPTNPCVCVLVASLTCSLSVGFSRQEYWSGLPSLLQRIFPTQFFCTAGRFFNIWARGIPRCFFSSQGSGYQKRWKSQELPAFGAMLGKGPSVIEEGPYSDLGLVKEASQERGVTLETVQQLYPLFSSSRLPTHLLGSHCDKI